MGRGILTGLVWGSVVGFGIVTVANQVVDRVSLSPISPATLQDDIETTLDKTVKDVAPDDIIANAPEAPDEGPAQITTDAPQKAPSNMDTSDTATTPNHNATPPNKAAPMTTSDTLPTPEPETATPPSITKPSELSAPKSDNGTAPDVDGDTPVLSSPQAMELNQPKQDEMPAQIDIQVESTPQLSDVPQVAPAPQDPLASSSAQANAPKSVPPKIAPQGQKAIGTKVGSFTDRQDTLKSNRLPSVSRSAQEDAAPMVVADNLPALVAFSADYTKVGKAPNMSVILVDIGEIDPDAGLLGNLPFPVTFAVDALAPGASDRAQLYRKNGFEVLALIGLPDGATAQDVAVTINQARDLMPVSIGFLDVPSASFQASRDIAAQVVASAAPSGHGLVSFSSGLNAMMQEATRADVPAALVFRDFDGRDQDVSGIKRFLDQAAFRAGIDEDIVLVGRAKSDTLKALVEWSLGNRAATVEIVPVSFLLTSGDENL